MWTVPGIDWCVQTGTRVLFKGTRDICETWVWLHGLTTVAIDETCEVITVRGV